MYSDGKTFLGFTKDIKILGKGLPNGMPFGKWIFGHIWHAFTNPNANVPNQGMKFNPLANDRSWQQMINFFEGVFA